MKEYLGYQTGDEVSNGIDIYEITAITKQSDGVYFLLKGKVRSVCFHELVMANYPLRQRRPAKYAPDTATPPSETKRLG